MTKSNLPYQLLAAALFALAFTSAPSATACSLPEYEGDGRYVGGDLVTQITSKADTIQIVRVTARHLLRRTYSAGSWYLSQGNENVPNNLPEFIDEFVYELSVVETLKNDTRPERAYYENNLRILGYSGHDLLLSSRQDASDDVTHRHPNRLPEWLLDRPGHDGYAFTGGAAEGAGLGLGECNPPYFLDVGQTWIALRDSMGRLYPASGAFPLSVDAEFGTRRQTRVSFNLQSLIPIDGDNDILLLRIRRALADRSR